MDHSTPFYSKLKILKSFELYKHEVTKLILLFYYPFNKRCCHQVVNISKTKPFDVKFGHIIYFKTVQVHFNVTSGVYQVLTYRYFSKIW